MKRTLFITSNRLGDAVLTTGVLHHLIDNEPQVPVTVVCGKLTADIFGNIPGVEKVVSISKRKYSLHWWDAFKQIEGVFWYRIVDFRGSALGFLPARHRHTWKGAKDNEHKLVTNAALIGEKQPILPKIPVEVNKLSAQLKLSQQTPILAIAPTANFAGKQWHYENFINLALRLTAKDGILPDARVLVLGAPGEEAQARPVVQALPSDRVLDYVGKTNPLEAAQLLSQADLFVGNDSGLMHTAVAVGIPTVGLFGIGKPKVYGPWGEKSLCLVGTPAGEQITRSNITAKNGEIEVQETLPLEYVLKEVQDFYKALPD